MNQQTPLLIVSDAPSSTSGLGRITRDLATRLHEHCSDIFRVGTLGYGGVGSRDLGFPQYHMTELRDFMVPDLPLVWRDFVGPNEPGVILTIWDASRLLWFARPDNPMYSRDRNLRQWLQETPVKKWGYFPIDAEGPHGKLSCMQSECMMGYDRVIAYTAWAEGLIQKTLGSTESEKRALTSIPHGIDTDVFHRQDRARARRVFHEVLQFKGPEIQPQEAVIGIVATNQARKDFGLAIQAVAMLGTQMPIRLFIQTDNLERYWSIAALLIDYGLLDRSIVNVGVTSDEVMSYLYTACDVTLGIGAGEGFGYPIFESIACGTPVITGSYGGQHEFLPREMLVEPEAYRLEGLYNCLRPVFKPRQWVTAITKILGRPCKLAPELAWDSLWPKWESYFRGAHQNLHQKPGPMLVETNSEKDTGLSDRGRLIGSSEEALAPSELAPTSPEPLPEPA